MIRKLYVKDFQGVGEANFRLAPTTARVGVGRPEKAVGARVGAEGRA